MDAQERDALEEQQLLEEPHNHQATSGEGLHNAAVLLAASDNDVSSTLLEPPDDSEPLRPPRSLTFLNGLAIVIGLQIGSGIFAAPSVVISKLSSPVAAVFAWFLAGIFVWAGASSFIELGTRVPHNGGMQEYLRYCYGDLYGFLFAWIWLLVTKPCGMAMVALVFSEYLFRGILPDQDVSIWILKAVALLAVILITFLNCMGTHVGTGSATMFLVLKVFGLVSIILFGFIFQVTGSIYRDKNHQRNEPNQGRFDTSPPAATNVGFSWIWMSLGNFTDALFAALFAYAGWESVSFVVGEIKEPRHTLPRILNQSMAITITLFILTTITFYSTLSLEVLKKTNSIAIVFGEEVFGRAGAILYAWIVCLSCLGTLNAQMFSAGRLTQAAGARNYLPPFFNAAASSTADGQRRNRNRQTPRGFFSRNCLFPSTANDQNIPVNAMVLNAIGASIYILIGSFRGLLNFKGMVEYIVYLATASGVLMLRFRHPSAENDLHRGIYLTPIFNPIAFSCVAALILIRSAIAHMLQGLIIVLLFGTGSLIYRSSWWQKLVNVTTAIDLE